MFEKNDKREAVLAQVRTLSLQHLEGVRGKHGIKKTHDLEVKRAEVDDLAMAHTRVTHTHEGVPVWGSEAIVHLNADGSLFGITDGLVSNIVVDTRPKISSEGAIAEATREASKSYGCPIDPEKKPEADLWVIRRGEKDHLAYRVQMVCMDGHTRPAAPVYFIDAHTFEVVFVYDNLQNVSATGTGTSLYSGQVTFTTERLDPPDPPRYSLSNMEKRLGVWDWKNTFNSTTCMEDSDNVWGVASGDPAVDVQFGSEKTYEYYLNIHGRRGLDDSWGPTTSLINFCLVNPVLRSGVHWGTNQNNASWCPSCGSGPQFRYGDGDGEDFLPFVSLDIVGHEMTHGLTAYTADLTYSGEPGALNESMSDVFGAMIERYVKGENTNTWRIGEDAYTPRTPGDALRYMDNPHDATNNGWTADDYPDHYTERYTIPPGELPLPKNDYGGVHINSGIPSHAFYLLAKGGTHHVSGRSMVGIGAEKAEKIWYRALTRFMSESTDFLGARAATLSAAENLYTSASLEYAAVDKAWCLVGVGVGVGVGNCDTDNDGVWNADDLCPQTLNPAFVFTDDPLVAGAMGNPILGTIIKAVHVTELRTAVDTWRGLANLSPAVWTDPTLTPRVTVVQKVHMDELRTRLNEAFTALGCTSLPTYTDPTLTPRVTVIQKVHVDELRRAAKGLKQ